MKVRELIGALEDMDPDAIVILQKDSEGNGFSPLNGVDDSFEYVGEGLGTGDVYPDAPNDYYSEADLYDGDDAEPCVLLYPMY